MKVLSFDTSHPRRTVINLTYENQTLSLTLDIDSSQQDKLLFGIDHLLATLGIPLDSLEDLVMGIGPGSFTGLRIGLSLAKGFAWAKSLRLHPVSSLEALALSFPWDCLPEATVIAMTDARMKKLYTCVYQRKEKILPESDLSPVELVRWLAPLSGPYWFVGDNLYQKEFTDKLGENSCHFLPLWIKPEVLRDHGMNQSPLSREAVMTLEPTYLRKSEAENQKQAQATRASDEAQ